MGRGLLWNPIRRKLHATRRVVAVAALSAITTLGATSMVRAGVEDWSAARHWNETLLECIRHDLARPTVHARNLFHTSVVMWDAWAAYDLTADQYLHFEHATAPDVEAARAESISYAMYRLLIHRFTPTQNAATILPIIHAKMNELGYDPGVTDTIGNTPAALGNRIAATMIAYGLTDGSNEANNYANQYYEPVNDPLVPALPGNPDISDPNRWQPLALEFFEDQSGNIILGGYPAALSPEWGIVKQFALTSDDLVIYQRQDCITDCDFDYWVYHDPGPPPLHGGVGDEYYKWGYELVAIWSSHLDPSDGVMWDISPRSNGNSPLPEADEWATYYDRINGGDWGTGHSLNPSTGKPYEPQWVPRGDYARVLAEFWADGPASETPPGHWFSILNEVRDHPLFTPQYMGVGPVLGALEWDVKAYLSLGGAMHDVAISSWGVKGYYDYVRPISAIRYMCDLGQCSDPMGLSYHPDGINLIPGLIEVVTPVTAQPGQRHAHLAGHVGKIALKAWRGPAFIFFPATQTADVGWILAENWWPYQRPSFVSPPFPGYVSGHSTYSRAAAMVMTLITGDAFFPGGHSDFECPMNEFLVFEDGPSVDLTLQWATYQDASDQTSLSRIWGGIHPPADDIPGRHMGKVIGPDAVHFARTYFDGTACFGDITGDGLCNFSDLNAVLGNFSTNVTPRTSGDVNGDGVVDINDLGIILGNFNEDCNP